MRVFFLTLPFVVAASSASAHHVKMSERAAERLDSYEAIGDRLRCLPIAAKKIDKIMPIDNYHVLIYAKGGGGGIFLGELRKEGRCRGLMNANTLSLQQRERTPSTELEDVVFCLGDIVRGITGGGGPRFSGVDGHVSDSPDSRRRCVLTGLQELTSQTTIIDGSHGERTTDGSIVPN